jgi:hypothetical protein
MQGYTKEMWPDNCDAQWTSHGDFNPRASDDCYFNLYALYILWGVEFAVASVAVGMLVKTFLHQVEGKKGTTFASRAAKALKEPMPVAVVMGIITNTCFWVCVFVLPSRQAHCSHDYYFQLTGLCKLVDVRFSILGKGVPYTVLWNLSLGFFWTFRIAFYWAFANVNNKSTIGADRKKIDEDLMKMKIRLVLLEVINIVAFVTGLLTTVPDHDVSVAFFRAWLILQAVVAASGCYTAIAFSSFLVQVLSESLTNPANGGKTEGVEHTILKFKKCVRFLHLRVVRGDNGCSYHCPVYQIYQEDEGIRGRRLCKHLVGLSSVGLGPGLLQHPAPVPHSDQRRNLNCQAAKARSPRKKLYESGQRRAIERWLQR